MSLAKQLTPEYMDNFYRGAYFLHFDMEAEKQFVCQYSGHMDTTRLLTLAFPMDSITPEWNKKIIRSDSIKSMDDFGWPRLGYRQIEYDGYGSLATYITLRRSAHRGMRNDLLQYSSLPFDMTRNTNHPAHVFPDPFIVQSIFNPKFPSFPEAVQSIREANKGAVALSESVALGIPVFSECDDGLEIYYKQNTIGHVNKYNEAVIESKLAKRASTSKIFQGYMK